MSGSILLRSLHNEVYELVLNRPEKANVLNREMIQEFSQQLERLAENKNARVLIISGSGKWFCGGADLAWILEASGYSEEENYQDALLLAKLLYQLNSLPMFTIARVNGGAMGGGIGLLSCCDMVIAVEDAEFCFGELKLGLIPATIMPYVMAAIGVRQTRRFMLSAENFSSQTAKDVGLLHRIVHKDKLEKTIEKQVQISLLTAPETLRQCKSTILESNSLDTTTIKETAKLFALCRRSDEAKEGMKSFLEKHTASWVSSFTDFSAGSFTNDSVDNKGEG